MFLLLEGEVSVSVADHGTANRLAALKAGDCFGEMSLLTGERRTATVAAVTDCRVVEIDKAALAETLKESPELLTELGRLLAQRQMQIDGARTAAQDTGLARRQVQYAETFADKVRRFFEM